jgi:hypothetical protein
MQTADASTSATSAIEPLSFRAHLCKFFVPKISHTIPVAVWFLNVLCIVNAKQPHVWVYQVVVHRFVNFAAGADPFIADVCVNTQQKQVAVFVNLFVEKFNNQSPAVRW